MISLILLYLKINYTMNDYEKSCFRDLNPHDGRIYIKRPIKYMPYNYRHFMSLFMREIRSISSYIMNKSRQQICLLSKSYYYNNIK